MPRMIDKEFNAPPILYGKVYDEAKRARDSEARLIEALRRLLVDHSKTARDMARAALKEAE